MPNNSLIVPPYAHHLNHTFQVVATVLLWGATLALLGWAVRMAREERSPLPVLVVVAAGTGSLIEPLYDTSYHLLWYIHGQWTLFTAFGLPQPVWVMPAYIMVFACPALLMYRKLAAGTDLKTIFKWAGLFACTTAAFEITAINLNLYGYYAHAPMRVFHYPLWICFMEAAQITGYAVLAATMKRRAQDWREMLAMFVVFPANFAFECLGAGFPTLMAINAPHPKTGVMWLTGFISIALAAGGLWWTAQLLVREPRALVPQPEPGTPSRADERVEVAA